MEKGRFIVLDGLRGVCAIAVLLRHIDPVIAPTAILPESFLAVDFFFLLSGFVLGRAYEQRLLEGLGPWEFMRLRIIRLGPLYWLGGVIALLAGSDWRQGLLNMAFVPLAHRFHLYPLNFPAWSLGCELLANAVFAVLIFQLRGTRIFIPILLGLAGLVACALIFDDLSVGVHWHDAWGGLARVLYSFFLGVWMYRRYPSTPMRLPALVSPLLVAALLVTMQFPPEQERLYDLVMIVAGLPLMLWIGARCRAAPWSVPLMSGLGGVSYGIYVLQIPLRDAAHHLMQHLGVAPSALAGVIFCAAVVALAWVLDRYFDLPARKWLTTHIRPGAAVARVSHVQALSPTNSASIASRPKESH